MAFIPLNPRSSKTPLEIAVELVGELHAEVVEDFALQVGHGDGGLMGGIGRMGVMACVCRRPRPTVNGM